MPWHRPLLVRAQLGRPQCGGSPASRGLAGLGVTGLSAARLRAGTAAVAFSAVLAFASRGSQWAPVKRGALTARVSRWAAPGPAHPATGPLTSRRRSAFGPTAGRPYRTPRCGFGRGPRADRVTRRSRSVSPCQCRSRHLATARACSGQHGASRLAVPGPCPLIPAPSVNGLPPLNPCASAERASYCASEQPIISLLFCPSSY